MGELAAAKLETTCRKLLADLGATLAWSWDGRLGAALATFPGDRAPTTRAAIEAHLGPGWSHETLGTAPREVQALAARLGGVRPGQWIAATDGGDALVASVWWPWSGGQTISIRVFPIPSGASPDALTAAFRGWFGL